METESEYDESNMTDDNTDHCYCHCPVPETSTMFQCQTCERWFHIDCLKSGKPSNLAGDIFFHMICETCSETGQEEMIRMKLQWLQVVMLTLYNLQLNETGKKGYFRWKEHICAFIDKNWTLFFGSTRKKTTTWFGTVAGTLSSGCPQYFKSGATELKEHGWWSLSTPRPPTLESLSSAKPQKKFTKLDKQEPSFKMEGLRTRRKKTSFEAAMELKAKRAMTQEAKDIRRARTESCSSTEPVGPQSLPSTPTSTTSVTQSSSRDSTGKTAALTHENVRTLLHGNISPDIKRGSSLSFLETDQESQMSNMSMSSIKSDLQWLTEKDLMGDVDQMPTLLMKGDEEEVDSDIEVDPCTITPPDGMATPTQSYDNSDDPLPGVEELLAKLTESNRQLQMAAEARFALVRGDDNSANIAESEASRDGMSDVSHVQQEKEAESDAESSVESVSSDEDESVPTKQRKRAVQIEQEESTQKLDKKIIYMPMSVYEEMQLLQQLRSVGPAIECNHKANRLKRKLLVRQIKRERGMSLFDLDSHMKFLMGTENDSTADDYDHSLNPHGVAMTRFHKSDYRILDRYQRRYYSAWSHEQQPVSFLNRLVGIEDDQLMCQRSPYTARMLKPFIRRDYESQPKKLRLLQEIQAYPHRNNPDWKPCLPSPVDYCYVRPQHIPSVNALCREFFWPGIDLSECLEYPDFSCVVLYRKVVIAFAFMVPDVKYNEAYISFIFTHPEWRGAGIAKFMLYHLIQTCMGKHVTLHVSASNPAMVLYQKFAFKQEEFCLNFYDKYFPVDSKECKHAFFLRLRR